MAAHIGTQSRALRSVGEAGRQKFIDVLEQAPRLLPG
jgi:hypothetical protein